MSRKKIGYVSMSFASIPNVGDVTAELLYQSGFKSAEELAQSDEETIADIDGIGPERAPALLATARDHVARKREEEALAAAAGEGAAPEATGETAEAATAAGEEERG